MTLEQLAGNAALKEQLAPRLAAGRLGQAYLISGPAGSGRHTLAKILAQAMVCRGEGERPCGRCPACKKVLAGIHPDVEVWSGQEGKPLTVDQIRQLRSDAYVRPNEAGRKVYVVEEADRLNPSAQNAMLKLLEEGPAYAAFLLLAENAAAVLPTVRSRCEQLALRPVTASQAEQWLARAFPERAPEERRQAALDCQGVLGRAAAALQGAGGGEEQTQRAGELVRLCLAGDEWALLEACIPLEKLDRVQMTALLDRMTALLGEELPRADRAGLARLLRTLEVLRSLKDAAALNVGSGHLAGWLCAALSGQ